VLLILMRHAEAGEANPARWPDDRRRPLMEPGRRAPARVAEALSPAELLRLLDPAGPPATISQRRGGVP
jgi:phosphohistidine phosphatase SixA